MNGSVSSLASGTSSTLTSPLASPVASPHHQHYHHPSQQALTPTQGRHGRQSSVSSVDAVLELDGAGATSGDFGLSLTDADIRAFAKDRQKKDNHNMSKWRCRCVSNSVNGCREARRRHTCR